MQQCPSCNKPVILSHPKINIITCTCGTVFSRIEGVGLISNSYRIVTDKADPVQPGTKGIWKGEEFTVLGRVRAWIEEFVLNYWTIVFNNGELNYLVEGYGLYAVYESTSIERRFSSKDLDQVKPNDRRDLFTQKTYVLERKYTCYKLEVEGEVHFPDLNSGFRVFEWAHYMGKRIELIELPKEQVLAFNVTYTSFPELDLTNLRTTTRDSKIISCANCDKRNTISAFPFAQSYACRNCGSRYSLKEGVHFQKLPDRNNTSIEPSINLGAKGIIKGIEYEVVGYAQKEEKNQYRSRWKEYTLYNSLEGFAFLSEFEGHWIYIRERGDAPVLPKHKVNDFTYGEEPFQLYNSYRFEVVNASGTFPYNIFNDSDKEVKEFISPPEVWIREQCPREGIIWYFGEHIDGQQLQTAFGDQVILPSRSGVGAVQPKGFISPYKLLVVTLAGIVFLLLAHLISVSTKKERVLFSREAFFKDSVSTITLVSDRFQLEKWKGNLQFDIYAPVSNSWLEMNATLVNMQNGTEYSLQKGVEYYQGYSDGESWSEGDTKETAYLSYIPSGDYQLQIQGIRELYSPIFGNTGPANFFVTVTYDTPNHRNLVVSLILLLIWAFVQYGYIQHNEKKRWSNSPFSPYNYED